MRFLTIEKDLEKEVYEALYKLKNILEETKVLTYMASK